MMHISLMNRSYIQWNLRIMDTPNKGHPSVKNTCCCPTIVATLCIKMSTSAISVAPNLSVVVNPYQ